MTTERAHGLLDPSTSPSLSEPSKAVDSAFTQKDKETVVTNGNGIITNAGSDAPLQSIEGNDDGPPDNEVDPTGIDPRDGEGITNSRDIDRPLEKDKKDRGCTGRERSVSPYHSDDSRASLYSKNIGDPPRRRKYLRGYGAYMLGLESRIQELEMIMVAPQSRRASTASVSTTSLFHEQPKSAIPELKIMTWEEYLQDKGKSIPVNHFAIDVLIDEPILFHQRTRKKHIHEAVAPSHAKEIPASVARRSEGLPSRIRINSQMILHHLWRISKRRFLLGKAGYPRVVLRPFKVLYLFENELRELLAELETNLKVQKEPSSAVNEILADANGDAQPVLALESPEETIVPESNEKDVEQMFSAGAPVENSAKAGESEDEKPHGSRSIKFLPASPMTDFEKRLKGEEAINDLRCLIKFIDEYLRPIQDEYDNYQREKVRFSELWHLLKPNQLAYVAEKKCPQHIWRIVQVTGGRPYLSPYVPPPPGPPPPLDVTSSPPQQASNVKPIVAGYDEISPLVIDCEYIDYNGMGFGPIFWRFHIDPYEEEMDIKSLAVVPYTYATKLGLVREEELRERGERFLAVTEPSHRYYSGKTLVMTPFGAPLMQTPEEEYYSPNLLTPVSEETVESEVIVDFERTFNSNPNWAPKLGETIIFGSMDGRECREPEDEESSEFIDYDMEWDRQMRNDIMATLNVQTQRYLSKKEIPKDKDLLLLPSRIFAFILRSRKWAALDIDNLKPIRARRNGFEDLELPRGHKDVVQALVQTHFRRLNKKGDTPSDEDDEEQFDLVRDKGKGLIILLHGAPGVGKTSTAECVAESNSKPLLPITCGDLGITARDVERKLEMNFRLAQAWGCVLLLDEADVFLAQRNSSDLERNAVVSVFLRVLEYYEGILFLTTNRVGAFDEAFKSRIHMALFYPWLNAVQTIKIWNMQMRRIEERLKTIKIDKEQILAYAGLHFDQQCRLTGGTGWNGRQIRNAFQSATALAQFEATDPNTPVHLQVKHFEIVARAAAEFDEYLIRTTGHSDAERAAFNMIRADTFTANPRNPMSWETMSQTRSYGGAGATQTAFGGGQMGGAAQAAFGNLGGQMQGSFGGGQQSTQGMNQGNFGLGVGHGIPYQPSIYGMQGTQPAQSAFMGGQTGSQWPIQNQSQSSMGGMQQAGMGSMSQQLSGPGQDIGAGQQAQGQIPGQIQAQGGNMQTQQGFPITGPQQPGPGYRGPF